MKKFCSVCVLFSIGVDFTDADRIAYNRRLLWGHTIPVILFIFSLVGFCVAFVDLQSMHMHDVWNCIIAASAVLGLTALDCWNKYYKVSFHTHSEVRLLDEAIGVTVDGVVYTVGSRIRFNRIQCIVDDDTIFCLNYQKNKFYYQLANKGSSRSYKLCELFLTEVNKLGYTTESSSNLVHLGGWTAIEVDPLAASAMKVLVIDVPSP